LLPELPLFVLTGNGQGNVVHRAQPDACWSSVTAIPQLQGVTRQIAIHRHPHHTFRFVYYLEAEQLPGKAHARSRGRYRKGHTIETPDGHVGGKAVPGPRCSGIVSRLGQAHLKSGRVGGDKRLPPSGDVLPDRYAMVLQPKRPTGQRSYRYRKGSGGDL